MYLNRPDEQAFSYLFVEASYNIIRNDHPVGLENPPGDRNRP